MSSEKPKNGEPLAPSGQPENGRRPENGRQPDKGGRPENLEHSAPANQAPDAVSADADVAAVAVAVAVPTSAAISAMGTDFSELSGAYVLDALSDAEGAAFEAHLKDADASRFEVTGLTDATLLLGLATAAIAPSPELKERVMAALAHTPQLPRLASTSTSTPATATAPAAETAPAAQAGAPVAPVTLTDRATRPRLEPRRGLRYFRPLLAVASVAAAVALVVGIGVVSHLLTSSAEQSLQASRLAAITAASDVQRAVADVVGGGTATLIWSNGLLSSAMVVNGIAALPEARVYELWYLGESGPRAAGTFTVDADGTRWVVLTGAMHSGDGVGVTIEPVGGSELPTTATVVALASSED